MRQGRLSSLRLLDVMHREGVSILSEKRASSFRVPDPCSPVEHGQIYNLGSPWLELSLDERERFDREIRKYEVHLQVASPFKIPYYQGYLPAWFTQRLDLQPSISRVLGRLGRLFYPGPAVPISRAPHVYWLDLSQFEMNPHLAIPFADRPSSDIR
ncbi:hypothetical protein K458DRAFT_394452 [Lentithecium fluviatile CBS 122367]|uniref:Uncharacterized protein n=1 Tax=Lentithecium fluviatile CBS 122367 TaxID=1168545 RepID=A0A6G1IKY3_9PLEO|nr:hypothetical protein K458DRAFT_394452 [Lentithecium fluviatile CBS 122367]